MEKNVNTYGDLFFDVAETFIKVGEPAKAALVSSIINLPYPPRHTFALALTCASLSLLSRCLRSWSRIRPTTFLAFGRCKPKATGIRGTRPVRSIHSFKVLFLHT
jgi:hypothetical protein